MYLRMRLILYFFYEIRVSIGILWQNKVPFFFVLCLLERQRKGLFYSFELVALSVRKIVRLHVYTLKSIGFP